MHINLTDTVKLKCIAGSFDIRRQEGVRDPKTGYVFRQHRVYSFNSDNDFRATVPKHIWDEVKDEYVDRREHTRYRDIIKEI